MVERPILFSGSMVRALLDGRKTMTRRVAKLDESGRPVRAGMCWHPDDPNVADACPYGEPGDRLWVRESFWEAGSWEPDYGAPGSCDVAGKWWKKFGARCFDEDLLIPLPGQEWRRIPSIHMPRQSSRILLEITATRLERLQAISEEDAAREGIEPMPGSFHWFLDYLDKHDMPAYVPPIESFRSLWQSINGIDSWDKNPLVWVVEFRRIE